MPLAANGLRPVFLVRDAFGWVCFEHTIFFCLFVTAPKDAIRKHHKNWNVVQSGHCTVVLLRLASHRQVAYRDTFMPLLLRLSAFIGYGVRDLLGIPI